MATKRKPRKGMNKFQKAAFRPGDHRTRRDDVTHFLELAKSDDPVERFEAANNLCPCHVRTRIDEVWQALFEMMEDSDPKVRSAAWHTLEDGGIPDDPKLDAIFARAVDNLEEEPVRLTRVLIEEFAVPHIRAKEEVHFQREQRATNLYNQKGKCDFCGEIDRPVRTDFETELPGTSGTPRFALICQRCDA